MRTLLVAAGGGGDALGAIMVRHLISSSNEPPLIATYAWERTRIDPIPGPRGPDGFVGLVRTGKKLTEVGPQTETVPRGRSTLPRLAAATGARLFLLDASTGAVGMRHQIRQLVEYLGVGRVVVVDVGGDVVASGEEPDLLSPLADALVLAACCDLPIPVDVAVAGPALDGELSEETVIESLGKVRAQSCGSVGPHDHDAIQAILGWHPTEATALLAAAALGIRGVVEVRRKSISVRLSDTSATVWIARLEAVADHSLTVRGLSGTKSLDEAETQIRQTTISEIDSERANLKKINAAGVPSNAPAIPLQAARYVRTAMDRGVDLITSRRLAEAVGQPLLDVVELQTSLRLPGGAGMRGPLWDVRALAHLLDPDGLSVEHL
jgi:hypothetical protein